MTNHQTPPPEDDAAERPQDDLAWTTDLPEPEHNEALDFEDLEPGAFVFSELFDEVNEHTRRAEAVAAVRDIEMLYQAHLDIEAAHGGGMHYRSLTTQLAVTRSTGSRLWEKRLSNAVLFKTMFTPVYAHIRTGELSLWVAEVIPEEGFRISDPERLQTYTDYALDLALDTAMTAAKLRKLLRDYAETLLDEPIEERSPDHYRWSTAGGLRVTDIGEGLAMLSVVLPAVKAHAVKDRLNRIAQAKRDDQDALALMHYNEPETGGPHVPSGETAAVRVQTLGELEHETAADLLGGFDAGGFDHIQGEVRVTVPALSLVTNASRHTIEDLQLLLDDINSAAKNGANNDGLAVGGNAWLEGFGAVPIDQVREIAGTADSWLRMFVDPFNGGLIATDAYKAPKALRDFLRFRDPECRFPGCVRVAEGCDKDHTIPYRILRETSPENLSHLCRFHHLAKHRAGWKMKQLGHGAIEWVSPSGKRLRTEPYRVPLQPSKAAPPPALERPAPF